MDILKRTLFVILVAIIWCLGLLLFAPITLISAATILPIALLYWILTGHEFDPDYSWFYREGSKWFIALTEQLKKELL